MNIKRIYTENKKYKELEKVNVGIDFCEWDDGSQGYIYFEEDFQGNVAEAFYKNIDGALEEYNNAELYHGEEKWKKH